MSASATIDSGERAVFVSIPPCRLMDTRPGTDNVGPRSTPLGPDETHTIFAYGVQGNCVIPFDALALVMNVAAIGPTDSSFLTVFPAASKRPTAANLNWSARQAPVSNAVTSDLSENGRLSFYNLIGSVDIAADVVGYYVAHSHDDRYYTKGQVDLKIAATAGSNGTKNQASATGPINVAMPGVPGSYPFVPTAPGFQFTPSKSMTCLVEGTVQIDANTAIAPPGPHASMQLLVSYADGTFSNDPLPVTKVLSNGLGEEQQLVSRSAIFTVDPSKALSFGVLLSNVNPAWTTGVAVAIAAVAYACS